MSKVYQYVEMIGTSKEGYREAISHAIKNAQSKYNNVRWFEVTEQRGYVSDDGIAWYQACLKIGYSDQ